MTPSTRGQPPEPSPLRRWLAPPFTAFVFGLHLVVVLARPGGLLQDPGTGWHLVTGRYILETANPSVVLAAARDTGIYAQFIGTVDGGALTLPGGNAISVAELKAANEAWLPGYMAQS